MIFAIPLLPPAIAALAKAIAFVGTAGLAAWGANEAISAMKKADEEAEAELEDEVDGEVCGKCGEHTLPNNPDDLLEEGWEEEEHRAPNRRRFKNPDTGEVIEFDKGQPDMPGWRGRDHYHRPNPNAQGGKGGAYLDRFGNPVNEGSGASHIPPGTRINNSRSLPTS